MPFVDVRDLTKVYHSGETRIVANDHITFQIEEGSFALIVGPSGAGKSTTLNLLGGMDTPTSGQLLVGGDDVAAFSDRRLTEYRRQTIGFVFQFYNLVPNLTALENVELAAQLVPQADDPFETLSAVGLAERANNFPSQLSGGEQQRVAIARALVKRPRLLLADEPTGALDYHTGREVLRLLHQSAQERGTTVIVITHNQALTPMADVVIEIADAQVRAIHTNDHPLDLDDVSW